MQKTETKPQGTREEHLMWCKQRALAYVNAGNINEAFHSMASDLQKHPETKDHPELEAFIPLRWLGRLSTPRAMREFIEGFD